MNASVATTYRRILLTPAEMEALDDGQGWYEGDDRVWIGGYIPDSEPLGRRVSIDLDVNGEDHDSWTTLQELPVEIRDRLIGSDE